MEISEHLTHDTVAMHLLQSHLIDFLTGHIGKKPSKMFYFSDGSGATYKNKKKFINWLKLSRTFLMNFTKNFHDELPQENFQINAEWHFPTTSHEKGACDGVGGNCQETSSMGKSWPLSEHNPIPFNKLKYGDYIACEYDDHWLMACVIGKKQSQLR